MNTLVYVDIDQSIHKGKMKVALNEKQKKLHGFSFSINIANFEAFLKTMNLISYPEFLISEIKDLNRNQKIYFKVMLRKKQGIRSF